MRLDSQLINYTLKGAAVAGLLHLPIFGFAEPLSREVILLERTPLYSISTFSDSSGECSAIREKAVHRIAQLLQPKSALFQELDWLLPNAFQKLKGSNLHFFFDNVKKFAPGHSAYFIANYPKKNENAVILGCDLIAQSYWDKSMAHELTHFLLRDKKIPTWLNEGLAQLIEYNAGGVQPELRLRKFQKSDLIPPLEESVGPTENKNSYALSYLFVTYLFEHFGGWNFFQNVFENADKRCASGVFWEDFICKGRSYLAKSGKDVKFTEKGLLRFFAIAVSLNHPRYTYYQISKWGGFTVKPAEIRSGSLAVKPAQFFRFESESLISKVIKRKSTHLEIYRVVSDDQKFQIFPLGKIGESRPSFEDRKGMNDFVVVVNVSATESAELVLSD